MESKVMELGSSLPVPCIQELVKELDTAIPPRYIRPEQQQQQIVSDADSMLKIPVIDMQSLLSGGSMEAELAKLDFACREWGFFQLVNHGVSSSFLEKVKKEIQGFFKLPMEEKKKYWQHPGEVEGFGQAFVVSEEQKLDWGDLFFMTTLPYYLRKPHLFPKLPLPLRETLEMYSLELKNLAMAIITKMGKALAMETEEMEEFFEEGLQSIRMNYYPPCPQPDKVIGLTPHTDTVALTILLQVNEVEGLQIKKDGKWIPVEPLRNAFIVNVGDILVMISNGTYSSVEHRATVNSERERLSIATFYSTKFDGDIGPARSLISQQKPALFKRMGTEEYFRGMFARASDSGKPYLDSLRL
ncbi:hypothetical protein SLEP1_g6621 [Rubroshorea leprosula]|uniref:Fe2OG dioxygenase domain-containing protein n=1 Tax=Rubroshorea leprosula TaxID=152421 RepID=A0AAV5I501_9ROSI|nr:hypothetical protein SLEP1_g6621 [Rubroshorea leprosula]